MAYTALNAVVGQELFDGDFAKGTEVVDRYTIKVASSSQLVVTKTANGIQYDLPSVLPATTTVPASSITGTLATSSLPATTNTSSWDAVGKVLTTTVNGVAATADLGSLDDEGVELSIAGGNLQLKNAAGAVISQTPITGLDAQTLARGGTAAAPTLSISNGNTVDLPSSDPATLGNSFGAATGPVSDTTTMLGSDGKKYALTTFSSSFGTPLFKAFPLV